MWLCVAHIAIKVEWIKSITKRANGNRTLIVYQPSHKELPQTLNINLSIEEILKQGLTDTPCEGLER